MARESRRDLATVARSDYWSESEGRTAVAAWQASGESAHDFGTRHGLPPRRLRYWLRRLAASTENSENASVKLIPIDVIQPKQSASIEIAVGKFRVSVARGVDPQTLRTVIEVLRSC